MSRAQKIAWLAGEIDARLPDADNTTYLDIARVALEALDSLPPDATQAARLATRARLAQAAEEAILAGFCEGPQFAHLRRRHHEYLAAERGGDDE